MSITESYQKLRRETPDHVTIVTACKKRTPEEVAELVEAGATDIGENYVQEAETMAEALGRTAEKVRWHLFGQLQKNKINKALRLFDLFQTVHSKDLAEAVDQRAGRIGKKVGVLIEINSAEEPNKSGISPDFDAIADLARHIAGLENLRLEGMMTMGPFCDDPEDIRPYFRKTRDIFERLRDLGLPDTEMRHLSMGMSDSYKVAIEEGSTMIRPGTIIFGPRPA